jgi:hypothetical protein
LLASLTLSDDEKKGNVETDNKKKGNVNVETDDKNDHKVTVKTDIDNLKKEGDGKSSGVYKYI